MVDQAARYGAMKKAAIIFLFVVINGTWALIAYLLYTFGVRPIALIVVVIVAGVLLGNLSTYAGLALAEKLIRKDSPSNSEPASS